MIRTCLVSVLTLFSALNAQATCTATSGAKRVTFVELYTSEGCDSCPPADRWLSTMKARNDVVPLSFHVDYWDYIGWKDPYAQKGFTDRQNARVQAQNSRSVYTPQVMFNGQDFTVWRNENAASGSLKKLSALSAPIELAITAQPSANAVKVSIETLEGQVGTRTGRKDTIYTAVLYENGLVSKVLAGENRGVTLNHDYVVRTMQRSANKTFTLPVSPSVKLANAGVAIIAETTTGEFLQAVNMPLTQCLPS
jgi:hypothetical protein